MFRRIIRVMALAVGVALGVPAVVRAEPPATSVDDDPRLRQPLTLEQCIATKMARWRFPQPKDGGIVEVAYPLILKTQ